MNKLSILLTLLLVCGCSSQKSAQSDSKSPDAAKLCPEKPSGSLDIKNVNPIGLSTLTTKESGQASFGKYIGYTFEGKSGQKFSYRTSDNICVWLYTQDAQLLSSGDLPKDGKYTIQISALQGSTPFNLEMSLGILAASSTSVPASTTTTSPSSPTSSTQFADLSQDQAFEIVRNWYNAKARIFAPPFDTSLVEQYTTGKLYNKTMDSDPETGRIAWLRSHNSYYTYNNSRINRIVDFSNIGRQPWITVNVSEELYLHGPNGIDSPNSGAYTDDFIYLFEKANGVWKISDYHKVNQ